MTTLTFHAAHDKVRPSYLRKSPWQETVASLASPFDGYDAVPLPHLASSGCSVLSLLPLLLLLPDSSHLYRIVLPLDQRLFGHFVRPHARQPKSQPPPPAAVKTKRGKKKQRQRQRQRQQRGVARVNGLIKHNKKAERTQQKRHKLKTKIGGSRCYHHHRST